MAHPVAQAPPAAVDLVARKQLLLWLQRFFLGWLFVYMLIGRFAQGEGGFFGRTADRVDSPWLQWLFLNIPLQFLLTLVVMSCASSARPGLLKAGIWVGVCNGILVVGHVILSVVTA